MPIPALVGFLSLPDWAQLSSCCRIGTKEECGHCKRNEKDVVRQTISYRVGWGGSKTKVGKCERTHSKVI